jgi:hypothetical protein
MKELIEREIIIQKMRKTSDASYVRTLQLMLDKKLYSFEDFVNTGRIMPVEKYAEEFGMASFNSKCQNICRYAGGFKAQNLSDGSWMINLNDSVEGDEHNTTYTSDNLKEIEKIIWEKCIKNN